MMFNLLPHESAGAVTRARTLGLQRIESGWIPICIRAIAGAGRTIVRAHSTGNLEKLLFFN